MRNNRRQRTRGFTLVEVLVSVVILSIGLVGLGQLYLAATWTYEKGRAMSIATKRAQDELEKVHQLGYAALMTDPLIDDLRYPASGYSLLEEGRGVQFTFDEAELRGGHGTVTIAPFVDNGVTTPNVAQVTVDIRWDGNPPTESRVKFVTLKTGPPPAPEED